MALLKYSLKTNIVKSLFYEIASNVSSYYYAYGRSEPWDTVLDPLTNEVVSDEDHIEQTVDSSAYEVAVRDNLTYMKLVNSNDACVVIRRINWIGGTVYDMYDDYSSSNLSTSGNPTLAESNFYVLTSDYNVYKCLFNNKGQPSIVQPTGTSITKLATFDGYVWKFMYTIPLYLREKFLTQAWIPVTTAISSQFYSKGRIIDYTIANAGAKYETNTWYVKTINVINPGSGYTNGDLIEFDVSPGITARGAMVVTNSGLGTVDSITVSIAGSGYTTIPQSSISTSATGTNLLYDVVFDTEATTEGAQWTELVVTGDGFNELNPYSLKKTRLDPIDDAHRGVFLSPGDDSASTFRWPTPQKSYGYVPIAMPVFRDIVGNPGYVEVDYIEITNPGFGYTVPLVFGTNVTSTLTDFDCSLGTAEEQKNEAKLMPIIGKNKTIQAIMIKDGGIGYTYANVDAKLYKIINGIKTEIDEAVTSGPTFKSGFDKARITLTFSNGDLQTKQSSVELFAVNGSVPVVKVLDGGFGYSAQDPITIVGDGQGFQATLTFGVGGSITKVNVINEGKNYKNIQILVGALDGNGAPINDSAVLIPVISPIGGHGLDAVMELCANTIMLTNRLGLEFVHGVYFQNPLNFRQISLIKDPTKYDGITNYRNISGSLTWLLTCNINQTTAYNKLAIGDILFLADNLDAKFLVLNKTIYKNAVHILLKSLSHYDLAAMSVYNFDYNGTETSIFGTSIKRPEIDRSSGELLLIDNRYKFSASNDETIISSTLISV